VRAEARSVRAEVKAGAEAKAKAGGGLYWRRIGASWRRWTWAGKVVMRPVRDAGTLSVEGASVRRCWWHLVCVL
jgi:hypothetical protein